MTFALSIVYYIVMIINKRMVKRTHYFSTKMLDDLAEYARETGVSTADVIRMAIKEYLKREARKI